MKSYNFPLYPITGCFTVGCILSSWTQIELHLLLFLLIGAIASIPFFLLVNPQRQKIAKSILLYILFIGLGWFRFASYYEIPKTHYSHFSNTTATHSMILKIHRFVGENDFSRSYYASLIQVDKQSTIGRILVYQFKDSSRQWTHGTVLVTHASIQTVPKARNPGAFDYGNYLKNLRIYHQIQLRKGTYLEFSSQHKNFWNVLENVKTQCFEKIEKSGLSLPSTAIIKALIFGHRKALDNSLMEAYAQAGVIHLLAISGLHIGILVVFLWSILKPMTRIKNGSLYRSVVILLLLWGFALFVGLSASVVRAVTIFSLLTIAITFKSSKNGLLLLAFAFLLLLLFHPPYLKQVGFQMSFLAVFGILWMRPVFSNYWQPKNRFLKWFWNLTTVSIAAQMAVAPLNIYYFHQFPGLFLVANWMLLPFFSGFLIGCILTVGWVLFFPLPHWLIIAFDATVFTMNSLVGWVAKQESFIFKNLNLSLGALLLLYALLIFSILLIKKPVPARIKTVLVALLLLQGIRLYNLHQRHQNNSLWILHQHDTTLLLHHTKDHLHYFSPKGIITQYRAFNDFKNAESIAKMDSMKLKNIWVYKNFHFLIVDSDTLFLLDAFQPTHILLRENPKINLTRLLAFYQPKMVISDGSNASWMAAQWKKTCKEQQVSFYDTRKEGALRISL